ncbi:hypothetical protein SAMN06269250_3249 [Spirosoma fluviale]|uniref:Uncharacterized protein n=1 Tax=Spirosoma fluviale TaxID=1597977 RepID=A0A286G363_9BACT|nr:hypothetical protein SAMN06269250_3249 [Spirosoma fluviale]
MDEQMYADERCLENQTKGRAVGSSEQPLANS